MGVKPGYKLTEVGVIPEDWEVRTLSQLGSFSKGRGIRKDQSQSGQIPCVRYGELYTQHHDVIRQFTSHISNVVAQSSKKLSVGDILFAASGETKEEIGKAAAFLEEFDAYAGSDIIILSPYSSHSKYLGYALNSPQVSQQKASRGQGDAVVHISIASLGAISLPVPPVFEQQAIATALSDIDVLLSSLDRLIAKKRDLKQAAMQELLTGRTRLPGFGGSVELKPSYKLTEVGVIPEDWEVKPIGNFAECMAGGTPATQVRDYWGGSVRWMSSGELNLKRVAEVAERITELGLASSNAKLLPIGCVLIGLAGQGKTRGTVAMNMVELATNQSIAAILPNRSFVSEYVYYNLDSRYLELRELSSGGGGRGGLNLKLVKSLEVPLPPIDEQAAIARALSDMDAELEALEARRAKTRELKQAMMQELLTGRIRLVSAAPAQP